MTFNQPKMYKAFWQSLIGIVLVALFIAFLWQQRRELYNLKLIILQANYTYMFLGVAITGAYFLAQGLFYQSCLALLHQHVPLTDAVKIYLKRFFVGSFIPAGFTVSQFTFQSDLKKYSINETESNFASILYLILGAITYVAILIPTIVYLIYGSHLTSLEQYGSLGFIVVILFVSIEFYSFIREKGIVYRLLRRLIPNLSSFMASLRKTSFNRNVLIRAFAYSFLVDVLSIVTLLITFKALNIAPSLLIATIGYVLTILLLSISPIFEGIGVVEVSLVYVLIQFNVPRDAAIAATLLFRLFQLWIPFFIGFFLALRNKIETSFQYLPVVLVFLLGVINIVSAVSPPLTHRLDFLEEFFSLDFLVYSRIFTLVLGFLLLYLVYNLIHRSYRAWQATVIFTLFSIIGHLVKGIDYEEAVFGVIVLISLYIYRNHYRIKNSLSRVRKGIVILWMGFAFAIFYGLIGFYFLDKKQFGETFTLGQAFHHLIRLYFEFGDISLHPHTMFARLFIGSIYGVGIFSLLYGIISIFQPTLRAYQTIPEEYDKAQRLIQSYGHNNLDYFKLYWDKSFFFSSTNDAFIAYKDINGYALVLGDPVGKNETAIKRIIEEFAAFSESAGLRVAFQQVSSEYLKLYKQLEWNYFKIGEEAEVLLGNFSLEKPEFKEFRSIIRRFEREGYRYTLHTPPVSAGLIQKLHQVSDEWLSLPFRTERIFTQSMFESSALMQTKIATVEDHEGQILAFISLLPDYDHGKVALDMMRRKTKVPNGVMEFLVVQTIWSLLQSGYTSFSLGLAPLSGVGDQENAGIPEKSLKFFYDHFNKVFSYKGLRQFKAKFAPEWSPRYLVYRSQIELPTLAVASVKAGQVGGFTAFFESALKHRLQTKHATMMERIQNKENTS